MEKDVTITDAIEVIISKSLGPIDSTLLNLSQAYFDVNNEDIKSLCEALISENSPTNISLNITGHSMDDDSGIALAHCLSSGLCKEDLQLHINSSQFGRATADAIASALSSGRCPQGLELKITGSFDIWDVKKIYYALKSGKCPENLSLIICPNKIQQEFAKAVGQANIFSTIRESAHTGNIKAQFQLALAYEEGFGVYKNTNTAILHYSELARIHYQPAVDKIYHYAKYYEGNFFFTRDLKKAIELYKILARINHPQALEQLQKHKAQGHFLTNDQPVVFFRKVIMPSKLHNWSLLGLNTQDSLESIDQNKEDEYQEQTKCKPNNFN